MFHDWWDRVAETRDPVVRDAGPHDAAWASQPVHIGPRQWPALTLRPLVAGPHNMPVITDVAEARKDLALATLAAITHADDPDIGTC